MRPTPALRSATERLLSHLDREQLPQPANLDALLGDPAARLVVAVVASGQSIDWRGLHEATYLGMLTLMFRNSLTRKSVHFDHVAVDPRHRRRGIATAM